jgi:hypothetical protein
VSGSVLEVPHDLHKIFTDHIFRQSSFEMIGATGGSLRSAGLLMIDHSVSLQVAIRFKLLQITLTRELNEAISEGRLTTC